MISILARIVLPALLSCPLLLASISTGNAADMHQSESIVFDGLKRTYLIHTPPMHDKAKSMPLLIALHGGKGTGERMVKLTLGGFDRLADEKGFVVVYPDGIEKQWNDGRSANETGYRAHTKRIDDVGFISALIDHLIETRNIDAKRVYVTGMSNGAIMSYRLACELSGKIAAAAPVTGNLPKNLYPSCSPSRPISVLAINNVDDALMPFTGGDITGPFGFRSVGKVLSTADTIEFWANHNQCSLPPAITQMLDKDPQDGTRVRKEEYRNCQSGTEVVLYVIEGGGHTWPSGFPYLPELIIGKTSKELNANEVIWDFFARHSAH